MIKDFNEFISTLNEELFTWSYFSNFEKAEKKTFNIKTHLNILNSLVGEKNIEKKFVKIVTEYPQVREVLPILIATRNSKIKQLKIMNTETLKSASRVDLFNSKIELNNKQISELLHFFTSSGLGELLSKAKVNNLVDYVFGVEVGMDTHARKNRSGDIMEDVVNDILQNFVNKNTNYSFARQVTADKILKLMNYDVMVNVNDRIYDFALINNANNKLYLIEVNLYGSGGTKLKSVAGEFEKLNNYIVNQKIDFIWVTDGVGWKTAENPMLEAFENNDNTFNLKQFVMFLDELS